MARTGREEQTRVTVADCVAACEARPWCKAFNYHKPGFRCALFDVAAHDVGGLKLNWAQDPYDYYEKPDLLYEDLCDIPQTCDPADADTPWECPVEAVPAVHFAAPVITLGEVAVPAAFTGSTFEAQWHSHWVTCGLLWYAWGWGTTPGAFEGTSGGALTGPTAEGSTHDWFTAFPGQYVFLTRTPVNPQDGQQFYVTVEVLRPSVCAVLRPLRPATSFPALVTQGQEQGRLPSNRRQSPSNRCRLPTNRRQSPSNGRRSPSNRR